MLHPINPTFAPLQAMVDELVRCGMTHAVTSPGSRNAPIVLTLAGDPRIEAVSVLDERSAGFVALGLAKASGRPVAVTCTSGSAAANLMPAVVEAWESRVPLLVLTADRPPELRDVGAGQAIDQIKLYGSFAKWFVEVGNHPPGRDAAVHHRALACRAYAMALGGRPGPVHLNLPLRDPLAPVPDDSLDAADWQGRGDGAPWVRVEEPDAVPDSDLVEELAALVDGAPRGAIIAGATSDPIAAAVARVAALAEWPVLADATSGLRTGPHDRSRVIAHYDVLLRAEAMDAAEVVLRVGDTPTSKPLRAWLARSGRQVVIDPHGAWHEPTRVAETLVHADAVATLEMLASVLEQDFPARRDPSWVRGWRRGDEAVVEALAGVDEPFEPAALNAVAGGGVPEGATVWVSSSMPIRDVETFFPSQAERVRFLANRGANGIDGMVSSALGAALASGEQRAWLLTGELALIHDLGGLAASRRIGADLTIVCVNNEGGGIFDFLPVAEHADRDLYAKHILTPSELPLAHVAAIAGLPHVLARNAAEVRNALGEPALIEYRSDRASNVAKHRELFAAVAARLAGR